MRSGTIEIIWTGLDRYMVRRDRHVTLGAEMTLEEAEGCAAKKRLPQERIVQVDEDGYRSDVTKALARTRSTR